MFVYKNVGWLDIPVQNPAFFAFVDLVQSQTDLGDKFPDLFFREFQALLFVLGDEILEIAFFAVFHDDINFLVSLVEDAKDQKGTGRRNALCWSV